jgi:hypothetical protein
MPQHDDSISSGFGAGDQLQHLEHRLHRAERLLVAVAVHEHRLARGLNDGAKRPAALRAR